MKLEKSRPEDAKECISWMTENLGLNDCSPRTLKGCTFFKIAGVLYLPVKPVMMLESLAPNPAVTGKRRLLAVRRAMDDLRKMYRGVEFVFLSRNNNPLDEAAKYYGFEEAKDYVLFRLCDAAETGEKAKERKKSLVKARLRNHAGALRADETSPERAVCHLSGDSRWEATCT